MPETRQSMITLTAQLESNWKGEEDDWFKSNITLKLTDNTEQSLNTHKKSNNWGESMRHKNSTDNKISKHIWDNTDILTVICWNCNKKGHYTNSYTKLKKSDNFNLNKTSVATVCTSKNEQASMLTLRHHSAIKK